jgi:hypothetical protein
MKILYKISNKKAKISIYLIMQIKTISMIKYLKSKMNKTARKYPHPTSI